MFGEGFGLVEMKDSVNMKISPREVKYFSTSDMETELGIAELEVPPCLNLLQLKCILLFLHRVCISILRYHVHFMKCQVTSLFLSGIQEASSFSHLGTIHTSIL